MNDAIAIWKAGVAAVDPRQLVINSISVWKEETFQDFNDADSILVVGAGKAGGAMAEGLETALEKYLQKIVGIVNVPEGTQEVCRRIKLHYARPAGSNFPTEAGIAGADAMLKLMNDATRTDIALCLISGGGSALLPAPVNSVSLSDKLQITKLLHSCGASIFEMNCVRKHVSRIKGGRLAEAFRGRRLIGLVISDVLRDNLEVIASGPTESDSTTYNDALEILEKYRLRIIAPACVLRHLESGARGEIPETLKALPENCYNEIIGSNETALISAMNYCISLNYSFIPSVICRNFYGEARDSALRFSNLVRETHSSRGCILFGGETTVTLGPNPGKGGRNQEFVLAMLCELGIDGMKGVTILSGGTDGEDGPTDAAGAIGTEETLLRAKALNLNPKDFLDRHDAYHFFEATGGLFKTGLTGTNVMDLGVILLH